jgi:glutamate-5-semialdehyde dehydrogenase
MDYNNCFTKVQQASRLLPRLSTDTVNQVLLALADAAELATASLLAANALDLARMDPADPKYDRLQLTPARIAAIAAELRHVASLQSPVGLVLEEKTMPNGLHISRICVPLGVAGVIYEARPNVTFDVFALCFKTGNAVILKGGSDADASNQAIMQVIYAVLQQFGIDTNVAVLLPPDREAATALMNAVGYVDVLIPRGSQGLIDSVRRNSRVPVIETGAGIVHVYADAGADAAMVANIVFNAKTRRVSVCNALDCLVLHRELLPQLPLMAAPLAAKEVVLYADESAYAALAGHYPEPLLRHALPEHFGTEFLSLQMAIKTVDSFDAALEHLAHHSSKHSEAIVSANEGHIDRFLREVDAAAVYANASTAFTDGAQFGLGAEIGISTQKLHARGPMGLAALTSYKWLVRGSGQVRG